MATNLFCEFVGNAKEVPVWEYFIPTNTQSVFPIGETKPVRKIMFSSMYHLTTDAKLQRKKMGRINRFLNYICLTYFSLHHAFL